MTNQVPAGYGAAPGYPAAGGQPASGAGWTPSTPAGPPAAGGGPRYGPLVIAALAAGGLGVVLAMVAMLLPIATIVPDHPRSFSTRWTFTLADYGSAFVVTTLLVAVLLVVAAETRGRSHLMARVSGGVAALFGLVSAVGLLVRTQTYAKDISSGDITYSGHLGVGAFVVLASAVLLVAACALVHHMPQRPAPAQPGYGPPPQYGAQPAAGYAVQQPGYPQQYPLQ